MIKKKNNGFIGKAIISLITTLGTLAQIGRAHV